MSEPIPAKRVRILEVGAVRWLGGEYDGEYGLLISTNDEQTLFIPNEDIRAMLAYLNDAETLDED